MFWNEHVEQREDTLGSPCFAKSPLTFAIAQCAGGQNQPSSCCSGHTGSNNEELFTCFSTSLSVARHPYAAVTPGFFATAFATIWFSDFSSHPKLSQRAYDSLSPCSSCWCALRWSDVSSLDISEQPRFFHLVLRGSHFEEDYLSSTEKGTQTRKYTRTQHPSLTPGGHHNPLVFLRDRRTVR